MPITITHDGTLEIATGRSRKELNWKNKEVQWSAFLNKISVTHRTAETHAEYMAAKKSRQDEIKDVGGYVGAYLSSGRRKSASVLHRQLVTLDIDFGKTDIWGDFGLLYPNAAAMYSTHKHSPESPRLRLIIPLDRPVFSDEYIAIARKIAGVLDIEVFDPTTFQPERLMYWPSTSKDGEYIFEYQDEPWLSADEILGSYRDWRDASEWPVSAKVELKHRQDMKAQEDPLLKPGIVGAFCRTYSISEAIGTFLADVYEPCDIEGRYTYKEGSTAAGVVTYDDKFAYSHHGTDPASGKLCNAFDLVRLHKFGLRDEAARDGTPGNRLPSYNAMMDLATQDKLVRKQIGAERLSNARTDFEQVSGDEVEEEQVNDEWIAEMEVDRKGNYLTSVKNIRLILENDPKLKNKISYNELSQKTVVVKKMPWDKKRFTGERMWTDEDWGCLRCYLAEEPYNLSRTPKLEDVMSLIKTNNTFHPIRQYLNRLEWDGSKRVDFLLIDYLGADDTDYVRTVTRKTLVAAVARVFQPGVKFDHVLTLVGKQGVGKSTLIKKLGHDWYTDTFNFNMLRGKEAFEQIQGVWLVEIGEMAGIKKAEVEAAKNFITSTEDNYRPAYGRETVSRKRQCVFFGTTNNPDFLRKSNGNRRFWPVDVYESEPVKSVFEDFTAHEIDQVWAEAMFLYNAGEELRLPPEIEEEAYKQQEAHEEADDIKGLIEEYLETLLPANWDEKTMPQRVAYFNYHDEFSEPGTVKRERVCVAEIWCECLKKPKGDMNKNSTKNIYEIMQNMSGWRMHENKIRFREYGVQKVFLRENSQEQTGVVEGSNVPENVPEKRSQEHFKASTSKG